MICWICFIIANCNNKSILRIYPSLSHNNVVDDERKLYTKKSPASSTSGAFNMVEVEIISSSRNAS